MEYVKIVIGMHAGCAGTDAWEFYEVNADSSQHERDQFAWECAKDHAEMYGIYPRCEYENDLTDEELDSQDWGSDQYSDHIEGWWELYDPDKHDGYRIGGDTSWMKINL